MVNSKIIQYVEHKLKQRVPESEIIANLKKIGLSEHAIHKTLQKVKRIETDPTAAAKYKSKDDELKEYIDNALSRNINKETIRTVLLNAGWKNSQIQEVFDTYDKAKLQPQDVNANVIRGEKDVRKLTGVTIQEEYAFKYMDMNVKVLMYAQKGQPVTFYHLIIPAISGTTDLILEEIRQKLIDEISLGTLELATGDYKKLDKQVQDQLKRLVIESFPHVDRGTHTG